MQGRLRHGYVSVEVETACRHCHGPLHLTIDSDMHVSVRETGAVPLVFMPDVAWANFSERTIIDSY